MLTTALPLIVLSLVGGVAGKVDGRATREEFDVAAMVGKPLEQQVDEAALAADPGDYWVCHLSQL